MKFRKQDADGIPARTLMLAKLLSSTAYSGLILFLPAVMADQYWRIVTEVTQDIVGKCMDAWAEDIELIEEVLEEVLTA